MFLQVIVDLTNSEVDKIFEYYSEEDVKLGSRVRVPFGNKIINGVVIGKSENSDYPENKIKSIESVFDEKPAITEEFLELSDYMRSFYYCTRASALRLFLPSEMRAGKVREQLIKYATLKEELNVEKEVALLRKTAVKQKELLYYLSDNGETKVTFLNERFGVSAVNSLREKNLIAVTQKHVNRSPYTELYGNGKTVSLTEKQKEAVESIKNSNKPTLIFGVTGSGKTEIYLKIISEVIQEGKSAIMLVPEISLTPQMLKELRGRFGENAAILHSGLSAGERFDEWWRLRTGEAKIAIGARSAIFAPLENVGVIIVDEEHDGSYLSESNPRYSTIEIAEFRRKKNGAKLILGSATPSVESFMKAENGEYNIVRLPDRINKRPMPKIDVVDMRMEVRRGNNSPFSSRLLGELKDCLDKGNQAILFLNQRGYSKTVICTECGHVQKCENCDVSLTYHMEDDALLCHYCGAKYKMIKACTECGSKFIRYGGTGTERVIYELKKLFPKTAFLRMDRDTTQNKESHFDILNKFSEHKADVLVGTQMIAKGHDFPKVTLVGILDADMSLHFSDYRSGERTFELLTQVAGRSGRAEEVGKVVLQTYSPDNDILKKAINYDYEGFYRHEISVRKATGFPPFTDIIRVLISSSDDEKAVAKTKIAFEKLNGLYNNNKNKFRFFGCMKAPIKRLQSKFRYQVLMRIDKDNKAILDEINAVCKELNDKTVTVTMEKNPNNLT